MAEEDKLRKKKKKMFPMFTPKFLGERLLGETLIDSASLLKGRSITTNFFNLMGDMKKQHIELTFVVDNVVDNKGTTKILKYKLSNAFLKRLIRRGRNKIDDSFTIKDSSGALLRVKTLIITANKTSRSVRASLVKLSRTEIFNIISKNSFEPVVRDLLEYKLQKQLKEKLCKVFPVRNVEIREIFMVERVGKETVQLKMLKPGEQKVEEEESHEEKIAEKIRKTQQHKKEEEHSEEAESVETKEAEEEKKEEETEEEKKPKKAKKPKKEKSSEEDEE